MPLPMAATSSKQQHKADIKLEQVAPDTEVQIEGVLYHNGLPPMPFTGCSLITINIKQYYDFQFIILTVHSHSYGTTLNL